jgi:hypothetical protein
MEETVATDFKDALVHLQTLLGRRVRVLLNVHGTFAGCVLEGKLDQVESLPPDSRAVNLVIAGHQGVVLDPEELDVLLVSDPAPGQCVLEFHLPSRVAIRLEQV